MKRRNLRAQTWPGKRQGVGDTKQTPLVSQHHISSRWRPYRVECTGSLPTSEVKRRRARLVLGWGTAREDLRVLPAFALHTSNEATGPARTHPRAHTHTHTHTATHTHAHTRAHGATHNGAHTHTHTRTHTHTHRLARTRTQAQTQAQRHRHTMTQKQRHTRTHAPARKRGPGSEGGGTVQGRRVDKHHVGYRWRPYRVECTGSRPTSAVKRRRIRLVLGSGTAPEDLRVLPACPLAFQHQSGLAHTV